MRKKVKGKKEEGKRGECKNAPFAVTLPLLTGAGVEAGAAEGDSAAQGAGPAGEGRTVARRSTATTEAATAEGSGSTSDEGDKPEVVPPGKKPKRTKSEAAKEFRRKVREGEIANPYGAPRLPQCSVNPLFDLPEAERAKLFAWLRECPFDDAVQHMLRDQGIAEATPAQLNDFFKFEAEQHWEKRIGRAAQEANALVQLVEKSPVRFSGGILAALGQEAFRQIASGQVEPDAMGKLATLFLKARSDERADQMQELKREKLRRDLQGQIDHALEKLAEEVDRHPVAREAFEALRQELTTSLEEGL